MKAELVNLKQQFLFRQVLNKQFSHYTETETNVLIGIYIMNCQAERCSCNKLFEYLSTIHRTPYKKTLLATIRKFKQDGLIGIYGKGSGTKIILTVAGKLHLFRLDERLVELVI